MQKCKSGYTFRSTKKFINPSTYASLFQKAEGGGSFFFFFYESDAFWLNWERVYYFPAVNILTILSLSRKKHLDLPINHFQVAVPVTYFWIKNPGLIQQ